MPTYDYKCDTCGHRFEVVQSMKDERLTECPVEHCAGPIRRLLGTGAGIIFKGSGFYQTDYRSDSYKQAAKAESTSASGGSDAGGSSSSGGDSGGKKDSGASSTPPASSPAPASGGTGAGS